jgi:hypothetical protein
MPYTIETREPSRPYNTLDWTNIGGSRHRLLGLILDRQLTWRQHIETVKAKCSKRLSLLKHLAGTQWGEADHSTLLRVHKMLVLSAVQFGSAAYGSARKTQLKKLDPCPTLQQRREIKTENMAVKITTKPEHPINRHLKNKKAYDQYGLRPSPTTPFFDRAKEICSMLEASMTLTRWSNRNTRHGSQTLRSILTQQC